MVRHTEKIPVRFDGRSYDWALERFGLDGERAKGATDEELKRMIAGQLDVAVERLSTYVIDRPETGNIILRPEAIYG